MLDIKGKVLAVAMHIGNRTNYSASWVNPLYPFARAYLPFPFSSYK